MEKKYYPLNKYLEENGIDLKLTLSFFTSEDGKTMQLCSCNISDGCHSCDYAWVVGETTLDDVIQEFIKY